MLVHVLREYNVNKILLSHLGLWPLQNKFVRRWLPISYLVIHISSLPFEILTLHDQLKNIRRVFENFHYIVSSILFIIKLSNEFLNHDKIRYLYKAMENHWNIFTDEFEMRILKNYSILSQKFALIYAGALYSITITYLMVPIKPILLDVILPLNESRPRFFMLSIEYKIDKDKYFVPLFFYNIIVVVTGVAILIGVDAMYVTRTIHACSLFSIIGQQFEKIISQTSINMKVSKDGCYMNDMNALFKKSASEQLIYDEYIICLKKYQLALKFASVLNSMYQIVSLTSLLLCGAIISLAPLLVNIAVIIYKLFTKKEKINLLINIKTLYDNWKNTQIVFEISYHTACIFIFIAKLWNEFWNYNKTRYLYEAMENHWNTFTTEFELSILKNYSLLSRKFTIFYSITLYFMTVIFIISPFKPILLDIILPLNESRPRFFVLSIEWRVDKDKYFVPILCYNMITVVSGMIILVSIETIYITRTIHACGLFSIISQQFEKIMSKADIEVSENTEHGFYMNSMNALYKLANEQVIYEKYVICLKKYQLVLEFVDVLNSMYQIVALISLLFAVIIISLVGIKVIYIFDQFEELLKYIIVIIGSILQLVILCYPGQKLLDESQNVFYQIYAVEWYTFSPRLKSLLITTLHRSFIPCGLTAGNLFSLSMATFAAVVRMGISYFTTFLSLKN
ncbi:OR67A protein, partial [Acromyrmex charruanus]